MAHEKDNQSVVTLSELYQETYPESLEKFHRWNAAHTAPVEPYDERICNDIISMTQLFVMNGKAYIYNSPNPGTYTQDTNGAFLRELISLDLYERFKKQPILDRIYQHLIKSMASIQRKTDDWNCYPPYWVNFRNGMLDLKTMNIREHDQRYFSVNQIPHEWKEQQVPDNSISRRFLEAIIPDQQDRTMFLQFVGYCFTPDTHLQKMLILHGPGGTGKSVLLKMVERAVGEGNYSTIKLQSLNTNRFTPAFLQGKLMNVYADLPSNDMEVVDAIKTIVGDDTVTGEYKGGDVFSFKPYCKMIFSANRIPKSKDDNTNAYYRRLLILPIWKRARDFGPELEQQLAADTDNFIRMACYATHEMYTTRGGAILESDHSKKEVNELYRSSDSVEAFIQDQCIVRDQNSRIEQGELYEHYLDYIGITRLPQATRNGFYSNLKEKGYQWQQSHGKRYFYLRSESDWQNV